LILSGGAAAGRVVVVLRPCLLFFLRLLLCDPLGRVGYVLGRFLEGAWAGREGGGREDG